MICEYFDLVPIFMLPIFVQEIQSCLLETYMAPPPPTYNSPLNVNTLLTYINDKQLVLWEWGGCLGHGKINILFVVHILKSR